jgi:16S rRNA (guanine(966)-N(2))-methyltransferase RsmD
MVGHELHGLRVLDAYGGSGLLGLEAWSRGADVVVVERDRRAAEAIRRNLVALDAALELTCGDVLRLAPQFGRFDGVLVDPPYALDVLPILEVLASVTADWLVLESDAMTAVPHKIAGLALARSRHYGGTALHLFRRDHD